MADTVKLPAIGPVKKQYVYIGGALIVGIVGYAWWTRAAGGGAVEPSPAPLEPTPDDYAASFTEGREPPPTVVGGGAYDDYGAGAVISTNTEWFISAINSLTDVGYNPLTASATLGKFLQRKALTAEEQVLVQAAKGFVGEPPLGGPWPIIPALPAPPSTGGGTPPPVTSGDPGPIVGAHGTRLTANTTLLAFSQRYARLPNHPDSVEGTKRWILGRNPWLITRRLNKNSSVLKAGWIIIVPTRRKAAA